MKRKWIKVDIKRLVVYTALVVCGAMLSWLIMRTMNRAQAQQTISPTTVKAPADPKITLMAMGDMLAHDSVVKQAKTDKSYDFSGYFSDVAPVYKDADILFCNPETPVAGNSLGVSGYPTFNAPSEFARDLSKTGCNVINLATNHIYDKGQDGINQSRTIWEEQKQLAVNGANRDEKEQRSVSYFIKNGVKCAFVAFADFSNATGYASFALNLYHDKSLVETLMKEARSSADVVIVSLHWGEEDSDHVSQQQLETAKQFSDLGADVIIGTGPHVLQAVEWLHRNDGHKTLVWFSIGNMLSSQLEVNQLTGVIAQMTITKKAKDIEISSVMATPTFMSYEWPAADRAAERLATRHNLKLSKLSAACDRILTMFPDRSCTERETYIKQILGDAVKLTR